MPTGGDVALGFGLLAELFAAGFDVSVESGRLWVRPTHALPPDARAVIQAHRSAIVAAVEQFPLTLAAIAEIARIRHWSAADTADAMGIARRCPNPSDWLALLDLVRATAGVPMAPTDCYEVPQ